MLLLEFRAFLIDGFINTLLLSLAIIVGGTLFAIVFAAGLSVRSTLLSRSVYLLVECLRDIPLMVTVLLVYFVLPNIGVSLDPVLVEHAERLGLGRRKRGSHHPRRARFCS